MHLAQLNSYMGLKLSPKCKLLVCLHLGFAKSRWLSIFKKEGKKNIGRYLNQALKPSWTPNDS